MPHLETVKEFDFLIHETSNESALLLAKAMQEGIHVLFKRQVTETYINNNISREEALNILGIEEMESIEYAWQSVESKVDPKVKTKNRLV